MFLNTQRRNDVFSRYFSATTDHVCCSRTGRTSGPAETDSISARESISARANDSISARANRATGTEHVTAGQDYGCRALFELSKTFYRTQAPGDRLIKTPRSRSHPYIPEHTCFGKTIHERTSFRPRNGEMMVFWENARAEIESIPLAAS